jgi:hypothetical protein
MRAVFDAVRAAIVGAFFAQFFRLLLLAVGAAQWACVAWGLRWHDVTLPWPVHGAAVAGVYLVNRAVVVRRRRSLNPPGWLRWYSAGAFVSLFCACVLLVGLVGWTIVGWLAGSMSAEAVTLGLGTPAGSPVDTGFEWLISLGMGATALLFTYGYAVGQRQLAVTRLRVPLPHGHAPAWRRIVQLSDLHVGQNLTLEQLRGFVSAVNALEPDLICITGDIADSPTADTASFFPVLGALRARYGVCAILGNHDHYAGPEHVTAALRRYTTFRVLRDEAVTLSLGGPRLHVIGLDDRGRDWARGWPCDGALAALRAAAPAGVPILLLCHRPDVFAQAAAAGIELTLSGHTHGGQLALPWFGGRRRNLAEFITPFARGLYERAGSRLYVNCGLGVTGQPIRLFTPREITVIECAFGAPE